MKNKITSALLALAIAFGLWVYVITTVSPGSEETYHNIPVVWDGEALLNERGLMLVDRSTDTVNLTLSGTRQNLAKVNPGNITLKADLSKIYEPGVHSVEYTPSYPGDVASNAFVEESRYPESITIVVEARRTKPVPVEIKWVGKSPEGYLTDKENRTLDYPTITVVGPASVADRIEKAVIEVDLSDRRESISESFRYTLCDAEGNPVDAVLISTDVQEVRLDVRIQRFKDLTLTYDLVEGGGATAASAHITLSVDTIRVSGSEAVLEELGDELVVGTINLGDIPRNTVLTYPINLPEGVTNLSGVTETEINIAFTGLLTKTFVLETVQCVNLPEGMEADIITQELTVEIRGPSALVQKLTEADIRAVVDFTGAEAETASYKVTIQFSEDFTGLGAVKTYTVNATVRPAEE